MSAVTAFTAVAAIAVTISGVVAPNVVFPAIGVAGTAIVRPAPFPISCLGVTTIFLQSTDFVNVLDGVGKLMCQLQIASAQFALPS